MVRAVDVCGVWLWVNHAAAASPLFCSTPLLTVCHSRDTCAPPFCLFWFRRVSHLARRNGCRSPHVCLPLHIQHVLSLCANPGCRVRDNVQSGLNGCRCWIHRTLTVLPMPCCAFYLVSCAGFCPPSCQTSWPSYPCPKRTRPWRSTRCSRMCLAFPPT